MTILDKIENVPKCTNIFKNNKYPFKNSEIWMSKYDKKRKQSGEKILQKITKLLDKIQKYYMKNIWIYNIYVI